MMSRTIPILLSLGVAIALVVGGCRPDPELGEQGLDDPLVGEPAPDFTLRRMNSENTGSLSDHAGEVVLIDFWATFCPPCRESLPALHQLEEELGDEPFHILSINVDGGAENRTELVSTYLSDRGLEFDVLFDHGRASYLYNASRIPRVVLVDREGVVRRVFQGATDPRLIELAVEELLEEQ